MAFRNVMHDLPDGPTARAVRGVELLLREPGYGFAEMPRRCRDLRDCVLTLAWVQRCLVLIFADRVSSLHSTPPPPGRKTLSLILNCTFGWVLCSGKK